ncbi:MAG: ADP-ribosylation factor-like protein [Promethearchaeota archaeon]
MSDWVSDIDITSKLGYKILIAGLSEAGKTAVKRIFFLKQHTEDVDSLSATINYERMSVSIGDIPITIVDLGGQKIFLKRFLSGFSPFVFSSVKVFIFLIDVANKTSRNNALQYFRACLEKLRAFSPDAEIFVFLHKNDLVVNSPNYESIHEQLKEQFQLECVKGPLRFFRTTIYRPETVIDAFGRIIELEIPEIARSELVEGRKIGEIEELHERGMTLREPSPVAEANTLPIELVAPKVAGDPAILNKLQHLMKTAVRKDTYSHTKEEVFLGNAAEEESTSETILSSDKIVKQPHLVHAISDEIPNPELDTASVIKGEMVGPELLVTPEQEIALKQEDIQLNQRISHLIEFYQVEEDKAKEIVEARYDYLFEMAAKIGIEIPLLIDIFLKYLPFVRKSQGEEVFAHITDDKLLQLFGAYLRAKLSEKDIVKCLVFISERPNLFVEEILDTYLLPERKERKKREKKIVAEKPPTIAHVNIPVESENIEGIITIPNIEGLGFKIDLVDDGLNANISLHLLGPVGQKELVGGAKVSSRVSSDEILYLLAYELNLPNMGFFEDGVGSIHFAAKIIHEALLQLHRKTLKSTTDISTKTVRQEKGYLTQSIEYIIPIEIEVDGKFIMLPESEKLGFSIEQAKKGFLISFVQRGFPIGQANIIESIKFGQLKRLLREAMQLPLESEGAVDFASRVILATIRKLSQSESKVFETAILREVEPKIEEDKTSKKLKEYLALLEKD